jgi:hypothetical protein
MKSAQIIVRIAARTGTLATIVCAASFAGCSSSATAPFPQTQVNPLAGTLQLAVGTANIFGDVPLTSVTPALSGAFGPIGFNVVESFRQSAGGQAPGDTDALVTTPTLAGPMRLTSPAGTPDVNGATILTGPGPGDVGTGTMTGTEQPNPGTPNIAASTFGVSTNASGWGLEPFNYTAVNNGSAFGSPVSYIPYAQPLFDSVVRAGGTDPFAFTPWGGPPAYDPDGSGEGVRDGIPIPDGVAGVSLGLDIFAGVTPVAGTYTLSVLVPTGTTGTGTKTGTATLQSLALLPAVVPATVTPDGTGGASVVLTLPPAVTEALVQIVDVGPDNLPNAGSGCNTASASAPVYYSVVFHASATIALSAAHGPKTGSTVTPTLCTAAQNTAANGGTPVDADAFVVQTIGFDYPAYEASYPQSKGHPAPAITGSNGQADITISSALGCASPGGGITTTCGPTLPAAFRSGVFSRYLNLRRDDVTRSRLPLRSSTRRLM